MRKFLDSLYLASGWAAACFIGAICTLVVAQVGLNLIDRVAGLVTGTAIGLTIPSYADFTGFFLAAASFLALAHTLRQGGHIRVTLVISHLPGRVARLFEFWSIFIAGTSFFYLPLNNLYLSLLNPHAFLNPPTFTFFLSSQSLSMTSLSPLYLNPPPKKITQRDFYAQKTIKCLNVTIHKNAYVTR